MFFEGETALLYESLCGAGPLAWQGFVLSGFVAEAGVFFVGVVFGEKETPDDDQDRRTSAEPEEGAPSVRGSVDKSSGERCAEQVAEGVLG